MMNNYNSLSTLKRTKFMQTNLGKIMFSVFFVLFGVLGIQAQIDVTASSGTANASYTTLKGAFDAVNAGTHTGVITMGVSANTTESAIAVLNASGSGSALYTSILIQPTGGTWTISGFMATELIQLNGADNVTINGLNSGGNALTISNTSTAATAGTSTLKFQGDATNNTITNCAILGSATVPNATAGGVIYFGTGTTTGNDGNVISYCNVGPAGSNLPSKLIFASGSTTSSAISNSDVTISNCNLYDYFLTAGCAGVYATTGNTDWNIINNKIYQTGTSTFTAAGTMYGIYFSNATYGNNVQITSNTIGYSSSAGTGTLSLAGAFAGAFQGIYFVGQTTAADACNLNNNTVTDISLNSTTGIFYGINNVSGASSNTININNNTVKNIALVTTTGTAYGINWTSATNISVSNNSIYNITRNGSGTIYGIYSGSSSVNEVVSNNTVHDITSTSATTSSIYGIYQNTAAGTKLFQNNTIYNFNGSFGNTFYGVYVGYGTTVDITGNLVYGFTSTGGTAGTIYGIGRGTVATNVNIYKNKVYGLSTSSSGPTLYGIYSAGGATTTIYNNLVGDLTTSAANAANPLAGIYIAAGTTANVYYNTVNLSGTSSGALFGSSAIYASVTPIVDLRNNIFVNNSGVTGAGLAAVYRRSSAVLTSYASASNNNLFYGSTIFTDGTNTDATMAAYKTRVSTRDNASVYENPNFISVIGANAQFLHINTVTPTLIEGGGIAISGLTTDFDGDTRNATTPDLGADEFTGVLIPHVVINSVAINPVGVSCTATSRTVTANVTAGPSDITSVTLNYAFNGIVQTPIIMTGGTLTAGTTSNFTAIIPVASPINATVTWFVTALDAVNATNSAGTTYADEPLLGATATATASSSIVCSGSPTSLSVLLSKDGSATIGAGSTTSATYSNPFYSAWSNTHTQHLITVAELNAMGLSAGNITSVALDVTSAGTLPMLELSVKIGTTSATSMAAFVSNAGFQTIYTNASYMPTVGVNTLTFLAPFNWDGTSNLVLEFCHGNSGSTATMSRTVKADATTYISSVKAHVSAATAAATICGDTSTNLVSYSLRPQFIFSGRVAITPNAISWSNGTTTVGSGNNLSVSPTANTTYTPTITYNTCSLSASGVTVTVNPLPTVPTVANSSQCGVGSTPTASVADSNGFTTPTFKWYTVSTGGTAIQTNVSTTLLAATISANPLIVGTNAYYVSVINPTTGCESARSMVTVIVSTPAAFTITTDQTICNGEVSALAVTSTLGSYETYVWTPITGLFTDLSATIPYVAGTNASTVYVKSSTAGVTTYTSTANNNTTTCSNLASSIVTVMPAGTVASSGNNYCVSGTPTLTLSPATGYGAGTIQWATSTDGITYTDIPGANAATYTPGAALTTTTYFKSKIKNGAGSECSVSPFVMVTVNNPSVLSTTAASRCGTGTVTLGATGNAGATLNWYAASTGGASLGTGTTFTTPSISSLTPYYVDATVGGINAVVGPLSPTAQGGTISASNYAIGTYYQVFDVLAQTTLTSVDVFPTAVVGSASSISIANSTGTILFTVPYTTTVTGGATAQTVILNFPLAIGTGYRIGQGTAINLNRNTTNASYPYTSPLANITGNNFNTAYYYYFYNMNFGSGCSSSRTAVTATVTPLPAFALSGNSATICGGQTSSAVTVTTGGADYDTYVWSPSTGVSGNSTSGWVFNPSNSTTYTLTASQSTGNLCSSTATVTVTVNNTAAPTGNSVQTINAPTAADATIANIVVSGTNILWYASAADATANNNPLPTTTQLVSGATYYATQTVSGCVSSSSLAVTVTVTLGTTSYEMDKLHYYPNPVTDTFTMTYTETISSVEVYNLIGQKVLASKPNATTSKINMSHLPAGAYVIQVLANGQSRTIKVIKK